MRLILEESGRLIKWMLLEGVGSAELLEGVDGVLILNVKSIQMKISELIFGEL